MSGSDKPIQRIGDPNSAGGGALDTTPQDGTVFANNKLVAVNGSQGAEDGNVNNRHNNVHAYHHWSTGNGSGVVFVNGIPVNFTDNMDTCGDSRAGGSGDVFVGNDVDMDTPANVTFSHGDDYDDGTPAGEAAAAANIQQGISSGAITAADVSTANVVAGGKSSQGSTQVPGTSQDIGELTTSTSVTDFPDYYQLSPNYTLGSVTRKVWRDQGGTAHTGVVFDHPVQSNKGWKVGEIVSNLKNLAINVIEPIKAQYPKMFVTNSFREGETQAQHGNGQACDMQFKGISPADYYDVALWIRDNVPYDQLLLEYKTGGSGLPWIHISYVADGINRTSGTVGPTGCRPTSDKTKVMTFLNDKRENVTSANGYGLVQLIGKY